MVKRRMKDRGNISLRSDLGLWPQNDEDENQTFLISFNSSNVPHLLRNFHLLLVDSQSYPLKNSEHFVGVWWKCQNLCQTRAEKKRRRKFEHSKDERTLQNKTRSTHSIIEMWWWIRIWDGDVQTRLYNTKHGNLRRLSEIYTATQYVVVSNFVAYQSQKYTLYPSLRRKQSLKNLSQTMA